MKTTGSLRVAVVFLGALAGEVACGGGGGGGAPAAKPVFSFPWDWVGVVGTGQSLSVGGLGLPVLATQPSANNLKLSLGGAVVPPFDPGASQLAMAPLSEPIRPDYPIYPSAYPGNIDGETPHTVMASQVTALVQQEAMRDYITVHTVVGESGQPMTVINKAAVMMAPALVNGTPVTGSSSGRAYAATLFEASAISRLSAAQNHTYGIGAIIITHGESDSGNTNYESDLLQLWSDYNLDLPPLTGQDASKKIPMLVSQQNAVPSPPPPPAVPTATSSASSIAQWKVGFDHPGDIICIGPKYQYPYVQDSSGYIHLSSHGYQLLGEKYGQVFFERVVAGHDWQPLQPTNIEVAGNVVTVHFHVPVPPLQWDETFPPPHSALVPEWAMGRGFEVSMAGPAATIDAVEIVGADTVKITCRNDLTGFAVVVGYAASTDGKAMMFADGTSHGTYRWGQLRDSDPFVGTVTGIAQPNYAVAFSMRTQ